jgi:hypothetical protein
MPRLAANLDEALHLFTRASPSLRRYVANVSGTPVSPVFASQETTRLAIAASCVETVGASDDFGEPVSTSRNYVYAPTVRSIPDKARWAAEEKSVGESYGADEDGGDWLAPICFRDEPVLSPFDHIKELASGESAYLPPTTAEDPWTPPGRCNGEGSSSRRVCSSHSSSNDSRWQSETPRRRGHRTTSVASSTLITKDQHLIYGGVMASHICSTSGTSRLVSGRCLMEPLTGDVLGVLRADENTVIIISSRVAGLNRRDKWVLVCTASEADAQFRSGNVSDISRAIRCATHFVDFRTCPVCHAPPGPDSCTCAPWNVVQDVSLADDMLRRSVFDMRFSGEYEGYVRSCSFNEESSSLELDPGVSKSVITLSLIPDQSEAISSFTRILIQADLARHVPANMPFASPELDPASVAALITSHCLVDSTSATAVIGEGNGAEPLDASALLNFSLREADCAFDHVFAPGTGATSSTCKSMASAEDLLISVERQYPSVTADAAQDEPVDPATNLTVLRQHELPSVATNCAPQLSRGKQVDDVLIVEQGHLVNPAVSRHPLDLLQYPGLQQPRFQPWEARTAADAAPASSSVGHHGQGCDAYVVACAAAAAAAAASAAVYNAASAAAMMHDEGPDPASAIPRAFEFGFVTPPLCDDVKWSTTAQPAVDSRAPSLPVYAPPPLLPSLPRGREQQPRPNVSLKAETEDMAAMAKAESRARKAHERKLRNRDAALRSNMKRSLKYKQLVADVEERRVRIATLRAVHAHLRAENARLRGRLPFPRVPV